MEKINSISSLNKNKRTKTNSYFNRLVPKLLEQSNKLTKELENRMKLNSFFAEFETKAFNQSVTRNIERFPENFRFQLTK